MARSEAGELFGRERGDGLAAVLGNLDQSVFGEPAYPTIESKGAHLLYFVIKNIPLRMETSGSARYSSSSFCIATGTLRAAMDRLSMMWGWQRWRSWSRNQIPRTKMS